MLYVLQIKLTADGVPQHKFALLLSYPNPRPVTIPFFHQQLHLPSHIFILDSVYCTQTPLAITQTRHNITGHRPSLYNETVNVNHPALVFFLAKCVWAAGYFVTSNFPGNIIETHSYVGVYYTHIVM